MESADKTCEQIMSVLDSQPQQIYAFRMEKALEQQDQKVEKLLADSAASKEEIALQREIEEMFKCHQIFRTSEYEDRKVIQYTLTGGTKMAVACFGCQGCGKSVLSKCLVDEAFSLTSYTTCYFFFKDDNPEQRDSNHAVCALLHPLFTYKPCLLTHALSAVRKNGPGIQRSFHNLWSILLAAATDSDAGTVIFILVAFDECEESTRYTMISMLRDFYLEQAKSPNTIEHRIHSLICHLPMIRLAGKDKSESIGREINPVITSEVNDIASLLSLDDVIRDYFKRKLLNITHRTQLWLKLVLAEIRSAFASTKSKLTK